MAVVELSSAAINERRLAAKLAEEQTTPETGEEGQPEPKVFLAQTAFLVMWVDGNVTIVADLADQPFEDISAVLVTDHYPTADEIAGAAAALLKDRTAEAAAGLAAQSTVAMIEQRQKQAFAAMQEAQLAAQAQAALAQEKRG